MDSQPIRLKGRRTRPDPLKTARHVGFGEFYDPAKGNEPEILSQTSFLARVEKLAPEVLLNLQRNVLPLYRQLPEQAQAPTLVEGTMRYGWEDTCRQLGSGRPQAAPFRSSMEAWAKRFDIAFDWVYDRAIATLRAWKAQGPGSTFAGIGVSFGSAHCWEEIEFTFSAAGWHPTQEQSAHFEARLNKAFEDSRRRYVKNLMERYQLSGFKRAPRARAATESQLKRFDWLVQWQVKKLSIPEIVRGAAGPQSETTVAPPKPVTLAAERRVQRMLREGAREVGLALRPGLPGRPRK